MEPLIQAFCRKFPQKRVTLHQITNHFYGGTVSCSGLLTGQDYIDQLKGKVLGTLLISRASLNAEGTRFLDDVTLLEMEQSLGVRLLAVKAEGGAFCAALAKN